MTITYHMAPDLRVVQANASIAPCQDRLPQHLGGDDNMGVLLGDLDTPEGDRLFTLTIVSGDMQASACLDDDQLDALAHAIASVIEERNASSLAAIGATRTVQ